MYKTVFQNRKVALLFAGMTIFGAITTVGSSEEEGTLTKTLNGFSQQPKTNAVDSRGFAEAQSVPDKAVDPDAGWGSSKPAVFGNYVPEAGEISGVETSGAALTPAESRQAREGASGPPPVQLIASRPMTQKPN